MRKGILFLALLLCFCGAHAEEQDFYTNSGDVYYHADPDCDRPRPMYTGDGDGQRVVYDRACYQKYPISEEAALAFDKRACPVCVSPMEPVYLGEHLPEWEYDFAPWATGDRMREWGGDPLGPAEYQAEVQDTLERFNSRYNAFADSESYPDAYAGMWANNADGYTYAVVAPTQELLDSFRSMFGGGAWIVPAKYSYNERHDLQNVIFELFDEWKEGHPEAEVRIASAGMGSVDGLLAVEIYGEDLEVWQRDMALLDAELDLPVWVCFIYNGSYFSEENMWAMENF